ncbi:MAG: DUF3048 domain-containing protein [Acidimicrobiales bacterium]
MWTRPSRLIALGLALAVLVAVWSAGGSTAAQTSDPQAAALEDYGPTKKAPTGGVLPPRKPGAGRWRYRGTLGKLGNNEQVVPPVAEPPVDDKAVAPLTGLKAGPLNRRAIVIKIDNVGPARPQFNINSADIVYEELVEAGATRLAAVYHSKHETTVGPVRSARSTDIGIAVSFNNPIFAFSGANSINDRLVAQARLIDRGAETTPQVYRRLGSRPAPHNLLTSTTSLLASAPKGKGPQPHFAYRDKGEAVPASAPTAHTVQLRYLAGSGAPVRYEWDARIGGWRRFQNGTRHVDASGVQVAPENVIVQIVRYEDAGLTDKFGEDLYEARLVGRGKALVFTDGHVMEARWTKPTLRSVTTFTDSEGNHIELTPGRTWVGLVPPGGVTFNSMKCRGQIATVAGSSRSEVLRGTSESDVIAAGDGADLVLSGAGDDLVCGGNGDDRIFGDTGNDRLFAGGGSDDLRGGEGNDRMFGGPGSDQLHGGPGTDTFRGGAGTDQLFGDPTTDNFVNSSDDVVVRGP